jgi:predicted dehydrogenase
VLPDNGRYSQDNLLIKLDFANGSIGLITYLANGHRGLGKECLEIFGGGLSARLEDYRVLQIYRDKHRIQRTANLRQNKGHQAEWQAFVAYLTGQGPQPLSLSDIVQSTRATLAAQQSLPTQTPITLDQT